MQTNRLQRTLHHQQQKADELTERLKTSILNNNFDSIWHCTQADKSIIFYVYKNRRLVYWSDSWLSSSDRSMQHTYDQWQYVQWDNALGICHRTKFDDYQIVVAIPIKYNYALSNSQLLNGFISPFRGDKLWQLNLRQSKDNSKPIFSYDGTYLFSIEQLTEHEVEQQDSQYEAFESFSYQSLLASDKQNNALSRTRIRAYYVITFILIAILFVVALVSLIRYRGFRRMRLGGKFQIVLTPTMMVILLSVFLASLEHAQQVFIDTQQLRLSKKAQYVQLALQNMYFWDMGLSPSNTASLNIDLRDMSFAYETDIHVYDLNGRLIGTSTPQLFERGLLPTHIAPEPFFSGASKLVQYDHIGNVKYLSAYTEFINGSYAKIGYIALPSFISQEEMAAQLQEHIMHFLPLYILLLIIAVIVVWVISHQVTSSLRLVTEQLQLHQAGQYG